MSRETDIESLEKLSTEQLKALLITHDYKGKEVKQISLDIILERERQSAVESYLNAAYSYGICH